MLYSPVLVISGLSPLIATSDGQATWGTFIRHTLSAFVATWSQWNRDIPVPLRLLLVLGFALSLIFHRRVAEDRMPLLAAILLGIAPILLAQRVVPFARVWLFLLPWYFVTAAPGLMFLLRPLEAKVGAGTTLFFALLSMVLSLWLGVGVVRSQSVVASPETGTLSDAQEIVSYLSGTLRPGELVVSDIPSNYPLRYYFVRSGLSASNLVEPSDVPESAERIIIVVNGQAHQTLDGILKAIPSARRAQLKEPVLLRRFSSASVYGY